MEGSIVERDSTRTTKGMKYGEKPRTEKSNNVTTTRWRAVVDPA